MSTTHPPTKVAPRFVEATQGTLTRHDKAKIRQQLEADIATFLAEGNSIDRAPDAVDDTNHRPVLVHDRHWY